MPDERCRASERGVDLLIFSSTGRAPCLARTLQGLRSHPASGRFANRILSVDGADPEIAALPELTWLTHIVMSGQRQGYAANIRQGVEALRSPYFFWCEDDWEFTRVPPPAEALAVLERHSNLAQVRLPKHSELLLEDRGLGELADGIWAQDQFFSLNPHYGRTDLMRRAAGEAISEGAEGQNVEVALSRWMRAQGCIFAAWCPTEARALHFGHEVPGGHSDYRWHLVSAPAAHGVAPGADSEGSESLAPRAPGALQAAGAPRVQCRLNLTGEFLLKGSYALWAVTKATFGMPFSRQARAFIRTVWRYWHPDLADPSCVGPTREDSAE